MIFPGAGYVELAVAARDALTGSPSCSIEDLEFKVALPLEADSPAHVAATITPDSAVFSVHRERHGRRPGALRAGEGVLVRARYRKALTSRSFGDD